jgi:hypothetical protein
MCSTNDIASLAVRGKLECSQIALLQASNCVSGCTRRHRTHLRTCPNLTSKCNDEASRFGHFTSGEGATVRTPEGSGGP